MFVSLCMESSSSTTRSSREKLIRRVISPAIGGRDCPICLGGLQPRTAAVLTSCNHAYCLQCIRKWSTRRRKCPLCNAEFHSWLSGISLSSRTFHKELLPPLTTRTTTSFQRRQDDHIPFSRGRRSRDSGRLPWRRSFGRPGSVASDVIHQRRLQWRASIYERRLQAVYLAPRYRLHVSVPINDAVKEGILRRIEPWIRRELQALLGDGDPTMLVHVVTSLYIAGLENKGRVSAEERNVQENFLEPLRPFLHDRTDMFWHELRCFAESPFNMETYDAVAEYKRLS